MRIKIPYKKIVLLVIVIVVIVIGVILRRTSIFSDRSTTINNNVDNSSDDLIAKGDLFNGVIINMNEIPNVKFRTKFRGTGVYDRNCVKVGVAPETGNPLVNCHAGIKTEYGIIDFNHVHDYYKNPCIIEGDEVVVEILDSQGNAKVQRVFEVAKKAIQEKGEMTN